MGQREGDPGAGSGLGTDVSLREYINARMNGLDRQLSSEVTSVRRELETSLSQVDKAVAIAAGEARERLEAHNNLISQMREQAAQFATREGVENRRKEIDTRIETLRDTQRQSLLDFKDAADKRISRIERFQYTLTGGIILLGGIGIANLVKVWTG